MKITHPDACKDKGMEPLCQRMDIPMAQVVAPANVVTDTNERDGAAIVIERYALNA